MGPSAAGARPSVRFWSVCLLLLLADQITKALARSHLPPGEFVPICGGRVGLRLILNSASAFGLVRSSWISLASGLAVLAAIPWYVSRGVLGAHPRLAVPLGLLLGGSLGNLADRIRFHAVTDFIDFRVWPVFNIADAAITLGVALLAIFILRERPGTDESPRPA